MINENIIQEIGSEFSLEKNDLDSGIKMPIISDHSFTFSGRTAIEIAIKNTSIRKVAFPSYCCDSMLVPFCRENIEISFYDVLYDKGLAVNLIIPSDADALIWCNYFGFNHPMPDVSAFKQCGGIVIEDITHSFMSRQPFHKQSDYLVASIRKWEPIICGGYCAAVNNKLKYYPNAYPSYDFISTKKTAMEMKSRYLQKGDESLKSHFLSMYKDSNEWLSENYSELSIDVESKEYLITVDADKHYCIRRNNAKTLYNGLSQIDWIKPLFRLKDMECPLFVPIVIEKGKRNEVRKKLIENKIYCPIHWPKPNADCESNLYDMELSLVCDQRYSASDMERIISVLKSI